MSLQEFNDEKMFIVAPAFSLIYTTVVIAFPESKKYTRMTRVYDDMEARDQYLLSREQIRLFFNAANSTRAACMYNRNLFLRFYPMHVAS